MQIKDLYIKQLTLDELKALQTKFNNGEDFINLIGHLLQYRLIKIQKLEHDYKVLYKKQKQLVEILKKKKDNI